MTSHAFHTAEYASSIMLTMDVAAPASSLASLRRTFAASSFRRISTASYEPRVSSAEVSAANRARLFAR